MGNGHEMDLAAEKINERQTPKQQHETEPNQRREKTEKRKKERRRRRRRIK